MIRHAAVSCVVAEKFPRFEASFEPSDAVATARVVFQGENSQDWYSVAMKPDGPSFFGVLPKPKKSLKAFRYYVEVTDKSLATGRSADQTVRVVGSFADCKGGVTALALSTASVVLQGPAGVVALPVGFAPSGVVAGIGEGVAGTSAGGASGASGAAGAGAGGGGLSATTVGLVGGAVAGGAVLATQVVGGGSTYSGSFQMTTTVTRRSGGATAPVLCTQQLAISGTLTVENFDGKNGHLAAVWSEVPGAGTCGSATDNDRLEGDFTSTGGSIQFSRTYTGDPAGTGTMTRVRSLSASLTDGAIVGTWTMSMDFRSTTRADGGFVTDSYPATGASVRLQKQ